MEKGWLGLPYRPISEAYILRFGGKVYKIPVSVVDDCPNRRGLKGMQTCVFCDVWGSAARSESVTMTLKNQIESFHEILHRKYKAMNYLVYFQAYTNSFAKIDALRANFETALAFDFVNGFVVGTRPDCLSKSVMALWQEYHEKSFVAVELGVQSFDNSQLEFMRRGHTREQSLKAIETIARDTTVDLGIHLIFGQPGETDEQMIETAKICNDLPITNVKLHNLHVLKDTPLEQIYAQGDFAPIERDAYARRVQLFLEHLSPRLFVHRLAAFSPRADELIAPAWTGNKMSTHQALVDFLREQQSYQSKLYVCETTEEQRLQELLAVRARPVATTEKNPRPAFRGGSPPALDKF